MRHNARNDLKRASTSANITAMLELKSLSRDDGKRSDGLTVHPWTSGECRIWDVTCSDTCCQSPRSASSGSWYSGERLRRQCTVSRRMAVELLGHSATRRQPSSDTSSAINSNATVTSETRSLQLLLQRSVAVERGKAACILGTAETMHGVDEVFYI